MIVNLDISPLSSLNVEVSGGKNGMNFKEEKAHNINMKAGMKIKKANRNKNNTILKRDHTIRWMFKPKHSGNNTLKWFMGSKYR